MRAVALRPGLRRAALLLAAALAAAGLATAFYTVLEVYRLHVVLPVWDEWPVIDEFARLRAGTYGLQDLVAPYNEHRMLVPRLFYFIDDAMFGMSGRFELAVMFLFQALIAAALLWLLVRRVQGRTARLGLAGFLLLVLFSLRQEQNFTFGFQLQFTGVFALAFLAILAFVAGIAPSARSPEGIRPVQGEGWIGLSWVLCAAATYTMASGVLAAPTLVGLGLLCGAPWRVTLTTAAVAALLAALYLPGLHDLGLGLPLDQALANPLAYPQFLAALIGDTLGDEHPLLAELFGAAGLAGAALAALWVAVGRARDGGSLALLGLMGFTIAASCATTYGRIGVGLQQAFEGRYAETSAIFWCALVLFWAPFITRRSSGRMRWAGAALAGIAMAALTLSLIRAEILAPHAMITQAARFRTLRDAFLTGVYDREAAAYDIFERDDLLRWAAMLRRDGLSLFGTREAAALGQPLGAVAPLAAATACRGSVTATADLMLGPEAARVSGLAWDLGADAPPDRLLVADAEGRVIGFGSTLRPTGRMKDWTGYAIARAERPVTAYALLADGRLCALGTAPVTTPAPTAASARPAG